MSAEALVSSPNGCAKSCCVSETQCQSSCLAADQDTKKSCGMPAAGCVNVGGNCLPVSALFTQKFDYGEMLFDKVFESFLPSFSLSCVAL